MLAQNFMKPEALGISAQEWRALVSVLGMLERGELVKTDDELPTIPNGFHMGCEYFETDCGTVGCIGGWAAVIMKHPCPVEYVDSYMFDGPLHKLYWEYPGAMSASSRHITPADAAIALRNYLTTGEARWAEALTD